MRVTLEIVTPGTRGKKGDPGLYGFGVRFARRNKILKVEAVPSAQSWIETAVQKMEERQRALDEEEAIIRETYKRLTAIPGSRFAAGVRLMAKKHGVHLPVIVALALVWVTPPAAITAISVATYKAVQASRKARAQETPPPRPVGRAAGASIEVRASQYESWPVVTTLAMNQSTIRQADPGCDADGTLNPIRLYAQTQAKPPFVLLRNGRPLAFIENAPRPSVEIYNDNLLDFGRKYTYQLARIDAPGRVLDASIGTTVETPAACRPGNRPPFGTVVAEPSEGDAPLRVRFHVVATDPDGDTIRFRWRFLNTTIPTKITTSPALQRTYRRSGTFQTTVMMDDGHGAVETATATIRVRGGKQWRLVSTQMPRIEGTGDVDPLYVKTGEPISLTVTPPQEPSGSRPTTYRWNFGDCDAASPDCFASPTSRARVTHRYARAGSYAVSVLVQYENGDMLLIPFTSVPVLTPSGELPGCCGNWLACCSPN